MDHTRCTRCSGEGVISHYTHRIWCEIPGGCYGCDGIGTREAQIANRIRHLRAQWRSASPTYKARLVKEGFALQAEYMELTGGHYPMVGEDEPRDSDGFDASGPGQDWECNGGRYL